MVRSLLVSHCLLLALVGCIVLAGCHGGEGTSPSVTVTGFVADDQDLSGLVGATVRIAGLSTETKDSSGAFSIAGVPTGRQTLTALRQGYKTVEVVVNVVSGENNVGVIYLPPGAVAGRGDITGFVRDSGAGVPGATITAGGKTARSKQNGSFVIYNLAPGNVTAYAVAGGKSGLAVVTVSPGVATSTTINISTRPPEPPVI